MFGLEEMVPYWIFILTKGKHFVFICICYVIYLTSFYKYPTYDVVPKLLEQDAISLFQEFYLRENVNGIHFIFTFNYWWHDSCYLAPDSKRKRKGDTKELSMDDGKSV